MDEIVSPLKRPLTGSHALNIAWNFALSCEVRIGRDGGGDLVDDVVPVLFLKMGTTTPSMFGRGPAACRTQCPRFPRNGVLTSTNEGLRYGRSSLGMSYETNGNTDPSPRK